MKKFLLLFLLVPFFATSAHADDAADKKRKTAETILEELRIIDSAIDQCAIENHLSSHAPVTWDQLKLYMKSGTTVFECGGRDLLGNPYNGGKFFVDEIPKLSPATFKALSGVADARFWAPYY